MAKVTDAMVQEINRMYSEGMSMAKIAFALGIGKTTVSTKLHDKRPAYNKVLAPEQITEANTRYQNGEPIGVIAKSFNIKYHHIFPYITNILTAKERRKKFPPKHKVEKEMPIREYLDAIGPDYDRGTMIQRIHSRTGGSYTEAETYYEAWRKDYLKRRVL